MVDIMTNLVGYLTMDFARPAKLLGPSLDGELLLVLASADAEFTGRQLAEALARSTHTGVLGALDRLVAQGIVLSRRAGRAKLYSLNREHLAAPWIEGLAGLRQQLFERMREQIATWVIQPIVAAVFGSVARGAADLESDIDVFLVRPKCPDLDAWDTQVARLTADINRWTGNDARALEFDEDEIRGPTEPLFSDVLEQGIEVGGSLKALRRLIRT